MYTATTGFASTDHTTYALAITAGALVTVTDTSVYSVIDEASVAATATSTAVALSVTPDGAVAGSIADTDFKVYVNGGLMLKSTYAYDSTTGTFGTVTVTSDFYQYDQVSVVYNTIK